MKCYESFAVIIFHGGAIIENLNRFNNAFSLELNSEHAAISDTIIGIGNSMLGDVSLRIQEPGQDAGELPFLLEHIYLVLPIKDKPASFVIQTRYLSTSPMSHTEPLKSLVGSLLLRF